MKTRGGVVAIAVGALALSGCAFTTSTSTRVDTSAARRARAGLRARPHRAGAHVGRQSTRLLVSSVGRCAELDQRDIVDVTETTTRANPVWVVIAALYLGAVSARAGTNDDGKVALGVGVGTATLAGGLLATSTDRRAGRGYQAETIIGEVPCDARPAPHVRVVAETDDGLMTEDAGDDGVVVLPTAVAKVRVLSMMGLRVRLP